MSDSLFFVSVSVFLTSSSRFSSFLASSRCWLAAFGAPWKESCGTKVSSLFAVFGWAGSTGFSAAAGLRSSTIFRTTFGSAPSPGRKTGACFSVSTFSGSTTVFGVLRSFFSSSVTRRRFGVASGSGPLFFTSTPVTRCSAGFTVSETVAGALPRSSTVVTTSTSGGSAGAFGLVFAFVLDFEPESVFGVVEDRPTTVESLPSGRFGSVIVSLPSTFTTCAPGVCSTSLPSL